MTRATLLAAAGLFASAAGASVTPNKAPSSDYASRTAVGQIERCLLDLPGWPAPIVYRQPDRPDDVAIVWTADPGRVINRVELHRTGDTTQVRAWMPEKQLRSCAP